MRNIKKSAFIHLFYGVALFLSSLFVLLNCENGLACLIFIGSFIVALIFSITFFRISMNLFSLLRKEAIDTKIEEEARIIKKGGKLFFVITTIWFSILIISVLLRIIF